MNVHKVKQIKSSKPFTLLDGALAVMIVVAIALCFIPVFTSGDGAKLSIAVNGVVTEYDLTDKDITLNNLTVRVKDGKAYVIHSDCANKQCVNSSPISMAGQTIVCLPNGVVIKIIGKSDLDGVT